ncbi:Lrp/AsnC family transcriptional regulator [Candidatus Woesearchaeota archaeon]|nr:Lrp/AsnC family transcriptional regulator [Candidatus Woesearchaeota archaeon]
MAIDETDKKILNELVNDSRQSFRELAKKVGVSVVTVLKRTREMEKSGIIKKYSVYLDYEQLGYDVPVVINCRVKKGNEMAILKKEINNPHITGMYDITGDFDIQLVGKFKSRRQLDDYVKKLQKHQFIDRTLTLLILHTLKEDQVNPLV